MRIPRLPLLFGLAASWVAGPAFAQDPIDDIVTAEMARNYDEAMFGEAAASRNARVREAAARGAGRLKETRALAWLLPLMQDPDGRVRRATLFAMGQIGGPEVFHPLRSSLANTLAGDLPFALEALGKTGDARAVSAITRRGAIRRRGDGRSQSLVYLEHAHPHVRGASALALFRLNDPSALPDVFEALSHEEEPEPRWRMVYAVYRLLVTRYRAGRPAGDAGTAADPPLLKPDVAAWRTLLRASTGADRPFAERVFAVRGLGRFEGERETLLGLLRDDDPRVVVAAARATARPWDPETAGRAAELAGQGQDALVREAAVDHLVAGKQRAVALLRRLAPQVADLPREYAKVMVALAENGSELLAPAKSMSPGQIEAAAWRTLPHFKSVPDGHPVTLEAQVAAAEVCGEALVPEKVAKPLLLELLHIKDYTVRSSAIDALAKRGAEDAAAAIVAAAKDAPSTQDMDVRLSAANALKQLKQYDAWLLEAAVDQKRPVREAARAALASFPKDAPALPAPVGYRLHGHDATSIIKEARALFGTRVRLETNRGVIEMMLLPDEAPAHCVGFAALIRKGFYDGLTWHRVVGNFVIQGGCPRGDGWGGPGYLLPDEIGTRPYVRGTVGMPKSAPDDTGGCQIFITHLPTPHLDGRYSVFAQVISGLEVMDRIRVGDRIRKATLVTP